MYFSDNRTCPKNAKKAQISKLGQNEVKIGHKLISQEPLATESRLTPQNYHKTSFTIGVFRYMYFSDKRKCLKNAKKAQISKLGQNEAKIGHKLISQEPLVIESRLTPQNDHKTAFTIGTCFF